MKRMICVLALVAGCATSEPTDEADQASSAGSVCANPVAYGAGVSDGTDDTVAINKAVCVALCPSSGTCACGVPTDPGYASHAVCLPAGELDVVRPSSGFSSIHLSGVDRLAIYGQGPASVLAMHGTGTGSCSGSCSGMGCPFSDWKLIAIDQGSQHIEIRDLTLTATGVNGFDKDSTRFLEFGDQITNTDDLLVKNTRMINACGDHMFLIGGNVSTGTTTLGVRLLDSTLIQATRRSIVIKHGLKRVVISNNTFETDGGAVDFDPSGSDVAANELVISNNTFKSTSATAFVLGGDSGPAHPPAGNVVVTNNIILGPGMKGGGLRNVVVRNNTIFNTTTEPEISLIGIAERLDISNNAIIHGSTAGFGAISVFAKEVPAVEARISGNTIVQAGRSPAIEVQDVQRQTITNNVISMTWSDAANKAAAGIRSQTDHFNVASVQLSGNSITGTGPALATGLILNLTSALACTSIPPDPCTTDASCTMGGFCHAGVCGCGPTVGSLQADRNFVAGAVTGITVGVGTFGVPSQPKGFLGAPPMFANNDIDPGVTTAINIAGNSLPRAYVIGGNQGGPVELVGDGSPLASGTTIPEVLAPNGSTYMVRGGTSAVIPALYFRENNTWVAQ